LRDDENCTPANDVDPGGRGRFFTIEISEESAMKRIAFAAVAAAFCAALGCASASAPQRLERQVPVEIIAHRGASQDAPENTVAAYKLAWEQGADAAETDVYLTKDGKVVCTHDKTFKRTAGVDRPPVELTWEEVSKFDVGAWKDAKYKGEPVPPLEDVLATIPPGRRFFLEIKSGPETMAPVKEILDACGKKHQIVIIGFDKATMVESRRLIPDVPVKWLIGPNKYDNGVYAPVEVSKVAEAKAAGFEGLNVRYQSVTPELIAASKAAGMETCVWTVDDPAEARRLADMGVTGITTDVPAEMLKEFGRK